jgi:hypothetical protein
MESHIMKKDTSSFDEKELQQIVIPLKQMMHEDDDEEENCIGETVTCLTGRVCSILHIQSSVSEFTPLSLIHGVGRNLRNPPSPPLNIHCHVYKNMPHDPFICQLSPHPHVPFP